MADSTLFRSTNKSLVIDPASLIPSILEALTGPDSKEIIELSQLIDANKGTKKDRKRLLSLIDKANKRISN